jgi:hypothetical protein
VLGQWLDKLRLDVLKIGQENSRVFSQIESGLLKSWWGMSQTLAMPQGQARTAQRSERTKATAPEAPSNMAARRRRQRINFS